MEFAEWNQIQELFKLVEGKFIIVDKYISDKEIIFIIDEKTRNIKKKFENLYYETKDMGFIPLLRKEGEELTLKLIKRPEAKVHKRSIVFPFLFIATIFTIYLDGYLRTTDPIWQQICLIMNINIPPIIYSILFVIALFGIIAIHEMGHLIVLKAKKLKASLPYFIPGIPLVMPTFGAIIVQREPAVNRDQLFDLGVSGPMLGLIATLVVTYFSLGTMIPITPRIAPLLKGAQYIPPPILFTLFIIYFKPELFANRGLYLDPIGWAAIVGMFITFLNTMPAWELDGGHMSRAVLGPKYHQIATFLTIMVMMLLGFYPMAMLILVLWMMSGGASSAPLDDYSPVSKSKKILFVLSLVITFLCMPFPI